MLFISQQIIWSIVMTIGAIMVVGVRCQCGDKKQKPLTKHESNLPAPEPSPSTVMETTVYFSEIVAWNRLYWVKEWNKALK